jgi:hypothetical protein
MRRRALRPLCATGSCRHLPLPHVPEVGRRTVQCLGKCSNREIRLDTRRAGNIPQLVGSRTWLLSALRHAAVFRLRQTAGVDQRGNRQSRHACSGAASGGRGYRKPPGELRSCNTRRFAGRRDGRRPSARGFDTDHKLSTSGPRHTGGLAAAESNEPSVVGTVPQLVIPTSAEMTTKRAHATTT